MRLQWNLLRAPNAAKTFQARVDRVTTERLLAIQRAEGWTDFELVQHALELVIDEADRNLATIIDKADAIRDFFTGKAQTPAQHGGRGSDDEVGPGGKTFQRRIKGPDVDRLRVTLAQIERWSESQLVRRGLKLVIEEASRDINQILDKLKVEYDTARTALNALSNGPQPAVPQPEAQYAASIGQARHQRPSTCGCSFARGRTTRAAEYAPARLLGTPANTIRDGRQPPIIGARNMLLDSGPQRNR
jgi:hypothetical protein